MKLKIAGIQLSIRDATTLEDRDANLDRAERLAGKAAPADLILLPELFTIGYGKKPFDKLSLLAEDLNGPTITRFCRLARRIKSCIVFGFPEKAEGKIYNSAAVISPKGELIGAYRKMHIPQFSETLEKKHFQRGNKIFSFSLKGVRIGVIICYDIRFPEITRKLALENKIDLLVHPVGFVKDETFSSWPVFTITRAIENQICILSVNRAGKRNGGSLFVPPLLEWKRETRFLGDAEGIVRGTVDTRVIAGVRRTYPYRKDLLNEY